MVYAVQAKFLQFTTIGIQILALLLGALCMNGDKKWNENSYSSGPVNRVHLFHLKYNLPKHFNFEEELLIERKLRRETDAQMAALVIFGVLILLSLVHCYLCFILTFLFYRKYLNIYFHIVGGLVLLTGFVCYAYSFVSTNDSYNAHFAIMYEGIPKDQVPSNPCKFPSSGFGFFRLLTGDPYECQESYTKFVVIVLTFANVFLYFATAFVIAFFVEEEDAAEMLYKQMEIVEGGPLTSLDHLPPLPYYARPLADSPTANRKGRTGPGLPPNFIRVEVPENWTSPKVKPLNIRQSVQSQNQKM